MYLFLFLAWMIFNANITVEIIILGLIFTTLIFLFMCKFMDYSLKKEIHIYKKIWIILQFVIILVWEIFKANFSTCHIILTNRYEIEPVIVKFRTSLKSKTSRFLLANSITLTPGTITVELEEDCYTIHCLDKSYVNGIGQGKMFELLKRLEEEE